MIQIYKTEAGALKHQEKIEPGSWINVSNQTEDDLKIVGKNTNISYHRLQKLLDNHELSRVEVHDNETLIILELPIENTRGFRTIPLGIMITDSYIITICHQGETFFREMIREKKIITQEKTNFTLQVLLKISLRYLYYLQKIQTDLEKREQSLYTATSNDALKGLLKIEKSLVYLTNALTSNELVLERITAGNVLPLFKSDDLLLEDAIIENKQAIAMANLYQALLASLTESYGTIISNNLNQVMKFLAGITIVVSIPTMISSFMGMNVKLGFFNNNDYAFPILVFISIIFSVIVAYIFKRKNWL